MQNSTEKSKNLSVFQKVQTEIHAFPWLLLRQCDFTTVCTCRQISKHFHYFSTQKLTDPFCPLAQRSVLHFPSKTYYQPIENPEVNPLTKDQWAFANQHNIGICPSISFKMLENPTEEILTNDQRKNLLIDRSQVSKLITFISDSQKTTLYNSITKLTLISSLHCDEVEILHSLFGMFQSTSIFPNLSSFEFELERGQFNLKFNQLAKYPLLKTLTIKLPTGSWACIIIPGQFFNNLKTLNIQTLRENSMPSSVHLFGLFNNLAIINIKPSYNFSNTNYTSFHYQDCINRELPLLLPHLEDSNPSAKKKLLFKNELIYISTDTPNNQPQPIIQTPISERAQEILTHTQADTLQPQTQALIHPIQTQTPESINNLSSHFKALFLPLLTCLIYLLWCNS